MILKLFFAFFKIGLFTIGGGYAMLPLIRQEILRYGWLTPEEFVDIVGIAEMTPGPIAVNAATFVGYRCVGFWGALTATLAVVLPSFISVLAVSKFWMRYQDNHKVQGFFAGVRPTVAGLVGAAALLLGLTTFQAINPGTVDTATALIAAGVFVGIYFFKLDPIKILVASAVLGLIVFK